MPGGNSGAVGSAQDQTTQRSQSLVDVLHQPVQAAQETLLER